MTKISACLYILIQNLRKFQMDWQNCYCLRLFLIFVFENMWKLKINQESRSIRQIFQPANILQYWFSIQNEPLDVGFQMRQTTSIKRLCHGVCFIFTNKKKKPSWLWSVSFETYIQRPTRQLKVVFQTTLDAVKEIDLTQRFKFSQLCTSSVVDVGI